MKMDKVFIAALAVTLFSAIFARITCGGLFNWVYKLEPTNVLALKPVRTEDT